MLSVYIVVSLIFEALIMTLLAIAYSSKSSDEAFDLFIEHFWLLFLPWSWPVLLPLALLFVTSYYLIKGIISLLNFFNLKRIIVKILTTIIYFFTKDEVKNEIKS